MEKMNERVKIFEQVPEIVLHYWQIYYILYPSLYKPFNQLITNTVFFERISPKACMGDRSVNRAQPLYIANDIFGSCWSSI